MGETTKSTKYAHLSEEEQEKQRQLFKSLDLPYVFSNNHDSTFSSSETLNMFKTRAFDTFDEMQKKIIQPMNNEFGYNMIYSNTSKTYVYLHCKAKGCKFQHGYTYEKSDDGCLKDIKSSPKVGSHHRHSIQAHVTYMKTRFTVKAIGVDYSTDFEDEVMTAVAPDKMSNQKDAAEELKTIPNPDTEEEG